MQRPNIPMLERLTWTEARDLLMLRPVGLLPIGAIEAHGPHLPLDTDVIIATGMARAGGEQLYASGIPAVVLPALSYSVSHVGACFAGTTPITAATFERVVSEVLVGHGSQGYQAICICNAHLEPAHVEAVHAGIISARDMLSIPIAFPDQRVGEWSGRLGEEFEHGARHAGGYETSIVMAERPEEVRHTELEELEPNWIDLPAQLAAGARDFREAGAELGYFGEPASATPAHGAELLELLGMMIRDSVLEALAQSQQR